MKKYQFTYNIENTSRQWGCTAKDSAAALNKFKDFMNLVHKTSMSFTDFQELGEVENQSQDKRKLLNES
jgi:hypothetical protein